MHTYWTLIFLGFLISLIGYIWLAVLGFKRSVVWGLLVLLFSPISAIIFAATNWYTAKKAFLVYAASMVLVYGAAYGYYSALGPLFKQAAQRVRSGELTQEQAKRQLSYAIFNGQSSLPPLSGDATNKPAQTDSNVDSGNSVAMNGKNASPATAQQTEKVKPTTADNSTGKAKTTTADKSTDQTNTTSNESPDTKQESTPIPRLSEVKSDPLQQKVKIPSDKVKVSLSRISHYIGHYFIITLKNGSQHRGLLRKVSRTQLVLDRKLYGGSFVYRLRKDRIKSIDMFKRIPEEAK